MLEKNIVQNYDQLGCQCKSQAGSLSLSTPLLKHLLYPLAVSMALNNTSTHAQENVVSVVNTLLSDTAVDQNQFLIIVLYFHDTASHMQSQDLQLVQTVDGTRP